MSDSVMSEKLKETLGIIEIIQDTLPLDIPAPMPIEHYQENNLPEPTFKKISVPTTIPETNQSDLKHDYEEARNVTYTLMEMTGKALTGALEVAIESQHPKAYDSFNALAQTMRGISKDLIEFQKIYKEIVNNTPRVANITQNNITVGEGGDVGVEGNSVTVTTSVTDILRQMRSQKKETGEVIDG